MQTGHSSLVRYFTTLITILSILFQPLQPILAIRGVQQVSFSQPQSNPQAKVPSSTLPVEQQPANSIWDVLAKQQQPVSTVPTQGGTMLQSENPLPEPKGRIAFGSRIYTINGDGTGLLPLAASQAQQLAWSPNGKKIANFAKIPGQFVVGNDYEGRDIYVARIIDADGTHGIFFSGVTDELRSLCEAEGNQLGITPSVGVKTAYQMLWSPDSRQICKSSEFSGHGRGEAKRYFPHSTV